MSEMLDAALAYAARGWYVFPLHNIEQGRCTCLSNCGVNSQGKHPRTKNGLHDATVHVGTITRWWERWPQSNIGIATGSVSGIYVVDIDNKRSVEVSPGILISEGENSIREQSLILGDLPETLTSLTGSGGTHLIFQYPLAPWSDTAMWGNRGGILSSVDIRGDGGYIVVPPSLHLSGNRYLWKDSTQQPTALPKPWIDFLAAPSTTLSLSDFGEPSSNFTVRQGEGQHEFLFKMASRLRGQHGLEHLALLGAIKEYDQTYLDPPLATTDPNYLDHVVKQAMKYEAGIPPKPVDTDWPDLDEGLSRAESFIDFMNHEPPQFKQLVSGILNSGECMVIGGQPNIGKSWIIMDMMLGIAEGGRFANHFGCSQGPVLFIDEEGSRRGNWERFQMLLSGRTRSSTEVPLFTKVGSGIRIDSKKGHATISRLLEEHRPSAVFLDSLVRMHGGDESNNRSMASFFEIVKRLMLAYETSFVFTHHVPKPPAQGRQNPVFMLRGASDIQGFPDSVIVVQPGQDSGEVQVTHTKNRNGVKLDPFYIRMQIDNEERRAELGYVKEAFSVSTNQTRTMIESKLASGPATPLLLASMTGLSESTISQHLRVMEAGGSVTHNSGWYQLALEEN